MNKDKLREIIKKSKLPDKAKSELNQLVDEKKAKAKIEFNTLTELENNKQMVLNILNELKKTGFNFKYEIQGKYFVVYLLYQEFELKEVMPLKGDKPPKKMSIAPKAKLKKIYLKFKLKLSKMGEKSVFKLFGGYFKFYIYLRINFMDKLAETHPNEYEFEKVIDIVLKQALEINSKEKLDELFIGSLVQSNAEKDNNFRKKIFESAKKELFFRLDSRKNDFSTENAKKTADLFENIFIKSLDSVYGNQEELLMVILEAIDKVSDSKNPKQATEYINILFPKIVSGARDKKEPLRIMRDKIEAL